MPWSQTSAMDQRTQFLADYLRHSLSHTELCQHYGISRKTGYKWIARYQAHGPTGLQERSRKPHHSPAQTPQYLVDALLDARQLHPTWGAKKLLKILKKKHPTWSWPARSTLSDLLKKHHKIPKNRRRRKPGHPGAPKTTCHQPNDLWCADFKGQFKTRDGIYCYPLTVTDAHSRYLLACQALPSTAVHLAIPVFRNLFRQFGLPQRIRTDNGVPFATVSLARLSKLSAWWIQLGILPELIQPGKPQQNGQHERMHKTLKGETTLPPAGNLAAQQRRFNSFIHEFNHLRPHEALNLDTPDQHYQPSKIPMPQTLPTLQYPPHFEQRYVSGNGGIRWKGGWVNVSTVCAYEYVGLEEVDLGIWNLYFGPVKLGRLLEKYMRVEDAFGNLFRHHV
jgi:putative transposase